MDKSIKDMRNSSKLHWLFLPGRHSAVARYDQIITESSNFAVLPTKGSIVPGWVLIVPKFPIARMADIPAAYRSELSALVEAISNKIEDQFGSVFSFEHGGYHGSKVSCGVDQAHLHLAPLGFDLVDAAAKGSQGQWREIDHCRVPANPLTAKEYWFVSSSTKTIFKPIVSPQSQFFRKIIAEHEQQADSWDYKTHPFIENVEQTIKAIGANG